jgi:hypothetical protein
VLVGKTVLKFEKKVLVGIEIALEFVYTVLEGEIVLEFE